MKTFLVCEKTEKNKIKIISTESEESLALLRKAYEEYNKGIKLVNAEALKMPNKTRLQSSKKNAFIDAKIYLLEDAVSEYGIVATDFIINKKFSSYFIIEANPLF